MNKLPLNYYLNQDVVFLAKDLLGKYVFTKFEGKLTGGIITETEAYEGITDRASHAYGNRRTRRTEVMFASGGVAYVYLCYGIHSLFNIVTNEKDIPHAVLIRGIYVTEGLNHIRERYLGQKFMKQRLIGPGKVSKALGIHYSHSGVSLCGQQIWLENSEIKPKNTEIKITSRVGVDYAAEDAMLPYRFILKKYHHE